MMEPKNNFDSLDTAHRNLRAMNSNESTYRDSSQSQDTQQRDVQQRSSKTSDHEQTSVSTVSLGSPVSPLNRLDMNSKRQSYGYSDDANENDPN